MYISNPLKFALGLILFVNSCTKSDAINPNENSKKYSCNVLSEEFYQYDQNKYFSKLTYNYDEFKNLIKLERVSSTGNILESKSIKHDLNSKNRPIKSVVSDLKGNITSTTIFEYYSNFILKNKTIFYPDQKSGNFEKYQYSEIGKEIYYLQTSGVVSQDLLTIKSYNEAGFLIKEEQSRGKTSISITENTYDSKNRLIKTTTTRPSSSYFTETTYDNSDKILQTKTNLGNISDYYYSGNLLTEIKELSNGKIIGGLKYEYDKNGNILKINKSVDGINYPLLEEREYHPNGKLSLNKVYYLKTNSKTETNLWYETIFDTYGNNVKFVGYSATDGTFSNKIIRVYSCVEI